MACGEAIDGDTISSFHHNQDLNIEIGKSILLQVHVFYLQLLPAYSRIISQPRPGPPSSQAIIRRSHKLWIFQCVVTQYSRNTAVVYIRIRELRCSHVGQETGSPVSCFCGHLQAISTDFWIVTTEDARTVLESHLYGAEYWQLRYINH
jgi:hypothetical protein